MVEMKSIIHNGHVIIISTSFILLSWNFMDKSYKKTIKTPSRLISSNWDKSKADQVIETYIHHRHKGLAQEQITKEIFKVHLPNAEMGHCYPFVCDWVFRAYADVVIEKTGVTSKKQPSQLRDGEVVYVKANSNLLLYKLLSALHAAVRARFVLITRDSDRAMPQRDLISLDILSSPYLIRWLAQNPNPEFADHPKVSCLPLGVQNTDSMMRMLEENLSKKIPPVYDPKKSANDERPVLVYMNYNTTHPTRPEMTEKFDRIGTRVNKTRDNYKFLNDMTRSKFVLSPRGVGMDCFRTYQAILMQSIPIVQDLSPSLTREIFGRAPVFVIPGDWKSFQPKREDFEEFRADDTMGRSIALAQYWFDHIDAMRTEALSDPLPLPGSSKMFQWNQERAELALGTYLDRWNAPARRTTFENMTEFNFDGMGGGRCYPFVCEHILMQYCNVILGNDTFLSKKRKKHLQDGYFVYVTGQITEFVSGVLLENDARFILMTSYDGVSGGNYSTPAVANVSFLLSNPNLVRWYSFGANPWFEGDHPKLSHLPTGFQNIGRLRLMKEIMSKGIPPMFDGANQDDQQEQRPILFYANSIGNFLEGTALADVATITNHSSLAGHFTDISRSMFTLCLNDSVDSSELLESLLLGSIPVVDPDSRAAKSNIFRRAPLFVLPGDWRQNPPGKDDFLAFSPQGSVGRSVVLAQYWFDVLEAAKWGLDVDLA